MKPALVFAAALTILLVFGSFGYGIHTGKPHLGAWIATGTITDVTGATAHVLMKDGQTYQVNASNAQVVVRGRITNYLSFRVGDTVKVIGSKVGPTSIMADRAVVQPPTAVPAGVGAGAKPAPAPTRTTATPRKTISIFGEEIPGETPPEPYVAPGLPATEPVVAPAVDTVRRGFVSAIQYSDRTMTLQTSDGLYDVDLSLASITRRGRAIGIGALNPGVAVQVAGKSGEERTIAAARVTALTSANAIQQGADVQRRVVTGNIYWVDYPSFTFKMRGAPQATMVLVDEGTAIRDEGRSIKFTSLAPGVRVKMTGYGSPSGGYVANEVFVISVLPANK